MVQATQEPRGYSTQEANEANRQTWEAFKRRFNEQPITYGVIFVLMGVLIGAFLFAYSPEWEADNLFSYLTNFATEGLSVLITIFVLDRFQAKRAQEQLRKELLADIKYGHNSDAIRAINRLRIYDEDHGWYSGKDSLLIGAELDKTNLAGAVLGRANLTQANLEDADLEGARMREAILVNTNMQGAKLSNVGLAYSNLTEANLTQAKLHKSNLQKANLERATLYLADLRRVDLTEADLNRAGLFRANLKDANLVCANLECANLGASILEGADLFCTNLRGAILLGAKFSSDTVLPDAQYVGRDLEGIPVFDKYYDPELGPEQMQRYTDPTHPDFWDPCVELEEKPWYCADANKTPH
ncbi:MAG: pentapeptide repeat-containing protein [Anaerolineaceae bacterium]|nr:pentapeptide repeat-containing protein [Anaerolineaceae bacterium]